MKYQKNRIFVTIAGGSRYDRNALIREFAALLDSIDVETDVPETAGLPYKQETRDHIHENEIKQVSVRAVVTFESTPCATCGGDGFDMTLDGPALCEPCRGFG